MQAALLFSDQLPRTRMLLVDTYDLAFHAARKDWAWLVQVLQNNLVAEIELVNDWVIHSLLRVGVPSNAQTVKLSC